ncbi:glycosyl transferase [Blastococcus saxobsidens]|uniref:Glycosyl transferase n=1 Tax=Blastococcus saxobsidens (strain DD2) TaxID=1146883 RepID=H6RL20_BLASD|nr:glycosyl transferase [Blastococcus saxobsidens]CCG04987.1 Glycosyl transferase [Blastococcus saxobsidens DD2]
MPNNASRAFRVLGEEGPGALAARVLRLIRNRTRGSRGGRLVSRGLRGSRRAVGIARTEGTRSLVLKALDRTRGQLVAAEPSLAPRQEIRMLVRYEDALEVDWTEPARWANAQMTVVDRPIHTAWFLHPPGESSGGAQTIFRFVRYLEQAGHKATIYLYHSNPWPIDAPYLRELIAANPSYSDVKAQFVAYSHEQGVADDVDAIFATGWETAYPVYRDRSRAKRFYFVQDFEPAFYPVGTENVLAENTYRFGFHGVTAGRWLADKLADEYGMVTSHFDFGVDLANYRFTPNAQRGDLFFYARPVTTRRGFELGVMALEHVARAMPDRTIHLAGWDTSAYQLPFPHEHHGILSTKGLADVYDSCSAALVLSLTNMSLLPLELLASGVIPVVNRGPNNDKVVQNPYIRYADPSPHALAAALVEEMQRPDALDRAAQAAASVADVSWDRSGKAFVETVVEAVRG